MSRPRCRRCGRCCGATGPWRATWRRIRTAWSTSQRWPRSSSRRDPRPPQRPSQQRSHPASSPASPRCHLRRPSSRTTTPSPDPTLLPTLFSLALSLVHPRGLPLIWPFRSTPSGLLPQILSISLGLPGSSWHNPASEMLGPALPSKLLEGRAEYQQVPISPRNTLGTPNPTPGGQ